MSQRLLNFIRETLLITKMILFLVGIFAIPMALYKFKGVAILSIVGWIGYAYLWGIPQMERDAQKINGPISDEREEFYDKMRREPWKYIVTKKYLLTLIC
jgi:hypothetical protein